MVSEQAGQPDDSGAGATMTSPPSDDDGVAARAYLDEVRREIDDEVRRRRSAGDLPISVERELDQLFLAHSPLGGRGAALRDMLRLVDASVFIDPVVPVASRRPGGATVKRGLRSLNLWYLRYITHQVSEFATAVSRALHVLDAQVTDLRRKVDALAVAPFGAVEIGWAHNPAAWWVQVVTDGLASRRGRVLHAACGDGWLVSTLVGRRRRRLRRRSPSAPRCPGSTSSTCASRTSPSTSAPWPRDRWTGWCCRESPRARDTPSGDGSCTRRPGPSHPAASCSSTPCPRRAGTRPTRRSKPTWRRPVPTAARTWVRVLGDLGLRRHRRRGRRRS